jgi:hypothetical protein
MLCYVTSNIRLNVRGNNIHDLVLKWSYLLRHDAEEYWAL